MGHRQTVQYQIRRRQTRRQIRVVTICLQNVQLKFESKMKIAPSNSLNGNVVVQLTKTGNSIQLKWVKIAAE